MAAAAAAAAAAGRQLQHCQHTPLLALPSLIMSHTSLWIDEKVLGGLKACGLCIINKQYRFKLVVAARGLLSFQKATKTAFTKEQQSGVNSFIRPSAAGGFATRCFPLHHLHRCHHRRCRTAIRERCAAPGKGRTWCVQSHPPPVHFQFDLPIREGWPFLRWLCVQHPVQTNETQRQLTTRSHTSHECVLAARISKDDDGVE